MTLDVVSTPIPPHVLTDYIRRLVVRGEQFNFIIEPSGTASGRTVGPLKLVLVRGGVVDPNIIIRLNLDNIWTCDSLVTVGEK